MTCRNVRTADPHILGVTAHKSRLQRDVVPAICARLDYVYLELNAAVQMILLREAAAWSVIGSRRFEATQSSSRVEMSKTSVIF